MYELKIRWEVDDFMMFWGHHTAIFYPCHPMLWVFDDGVHKDLVNQCGCTAYETMRDKIESGFITSIRSYPTDSPCTAYYCSPMYGKEQI